MNLDYYLRRSEFNTPEVRLHEYLFNMSKDSLDVRPAYNQSETVRVNFGMALLQIYGLVSFTNGDNLFAFKN